MSGHNSYTLWVSKANYLMVNGKKEKIVDTFFTSSPMHNSDNFNIKTDDGCYEFGDECVDWSELSERYEEDYGTEITLEELKGHYKTHFMSEEQFGDLLNEWRKGILIDAFTKYHESMLVLDPTPNAKEIVDELLHD
jgi:hypothetical protein